MVSILLLTKLSTIHVLSMSTPATSLEVTERLSLSFWRSFMRKDKPSCLTALSWLQAVRGEGGSHFTFKDLSEAIDKVGIRGKLSTSPLSIELPGTPSANVLTYWHSLTPVGLRLVNASIDCLGIMMVQDKEFFVGCCLPKAGSGISGECSIITHSWPACVRVLMEGQAWDVQIQGATGGSRPRVLSKVLL